MVFVPTVVNATCRDFPTLLVVEEEDVRSVTFVEFLVDVVVAK